MSTRPTDVAAAGYRERIAHERAQVADSLRQIDAALRLDMRAMRDAAGHPPAPLSPPSLPPTPLSEIPEEAAARLVQNAVAVTEGQVDVLMRATQALVDRAGAATNIGKHPLRT